MPGRPFSLHEKVDLCRGGFAVGVLVDHALQVSWGVHHGSESAARRFGNDLIGPLFASSVVYVMGFFVLSGFCIERSVGRLSPSGAFPAWDYLRARASRILPLYLAALLFTLVVERLIASSRPWTWPNGIEGAVVVYQLLLVQNLTQTYGSFVASWSLTNEAFYYLMYGALAWLLAARPGAASRLGLAVCAATAFVTQALYATVARTPFVYGFGMLLGLGTVWFLGALAAREGAAWLRSPRVRLAARLWPLVFASALVWKYLHLTPQGVYLIPGAAFTLMLLRFLDVEARRKGEDRADIGPWRSWWVESLGLMSYPMYLFHGPLLMLAGSVLMRSGLAVDWRLTWAGLTALGLVSGLALGRAVERPLLAWRSAWLKGAAPVRGSNRAGLTAAGLSR